MGKILIIKNADFSVNAIESHHIEPIVIDYSPSKDNKWQYIGASTTEDPCAYMIEVKSGDIVSIIANSKNKNNGCTVLCKNNPSSITENIPVVLANGETERYIYTSGETRTFNITENCYFYVLLHIKNISTGQIWTPSKLTINGKDVEMPSY